MIDKDEAIRLLRKEVANKGEDFVYERSDCVYVDHVTGQPSCIVGHALADAGVDMSTFYGAANIRGILDHSFRDLLDYEASLVFGAAQIAQDEHVPWGKALAEAEDKYRLIGGTE